jgi:hypothetical protein
VQHNGRDDGEGFNVMHMTQEAKSCLQVYYYFRKGFGNASVQTKDGAHSVELEVKNILCENISALKKYLLFSLQMINGNSR